MKLPFTEMGETWAEQVWGGGGSGGLQLSVEHSKLAIPVRH